MMNIMRLNFIPASSSEIPSIIPDMPGIDDMILDSEPL
jgi:hypothetical protein